jgi:hypothetical protein
VTELEPDEPIPELRALYRGLRPAEPADELAETAPETERVVRWAQGAWRALPVPAMALPRRRAPARRSHARRWVLAAAGLLALLTLAWRLRPRTTEPARRAELGAFSAPEPRVEILELTPERVELRSGPVRLVLLGPPTPAPTDDPSGS